MTDELLLEGEPFSFQPEVDSELDFEDSAAEKAQRKQTDRDCKGLRVLEWLEKGPSSLREYIAYMEQRLRATPRLVEGHQQLRKLRAKGLRKDEFDRELSRLVQKFPEIEQYYFPQEYKVGTVAEELAQVRCKLSRARLAFQIWHRTGNRPKEVGFLHLCSPRPRPNGPLILWTIGGFKHNDATLDQNQLREIKMIAGAIAQNPRTRTAKPVLILFGGYAPDEDERTGYRRANAIKAALVNELKKIDTTLLAFVGFHIVAEPWCSEVPIAMRELNPPPNVPIPIPRPSPNSPVVKPLDLSSKGTPLPPAPPPPPPGSGRSVQDAIRRRIDDALQRHGVKSPAIRKAIADSAIFQGDLAVQAAVEQAGVSSPVKKAIIETVRKLTSEKGQ
jgi:hypothetical protein